MNNVDFKFVNSISLLSDLCLNFENYTVNDFIDDLLDEIGDYIVTKRKELIK